MAFIQAKKHSISQRTAIATALLLALPTVSGTALAADAAAAKKPGKLAEVNVAADSEKSEYVAERVSSPKQPKPLIDTPQTIVVVKKELFQQQQAISLSDTLRNTPGITMLMGENGNTATGDSIFMRGFDTQNSIYVDGIRDLGSISRDTFNTEQVEIAKGPAGVDNGRGASSGYINMSTKTAALDEFTTASAVLGSASDKRVTADVNRTLAMDNAAIRVNVMRRDSGVVGRDVVENTSTGLAASLAFGIDTATRTTLNLLHVQQDNIPDGGLPTVGLNGYLNADYTRAFPNNDGPGLKPVAKTSFYGSKDDFDHVNVDMLTLRVAHDINDKVTLTNTSRYGVSSQDYVLTGVMNIAIPAATKADPNTWTVARTRQGKDQNNQILINQTNLNAVIDAGGFTHNIASGIEFSHESQTNYSLGLPTGTTQAAANLYNPALTQIFAMPVRTGAKAAGLTNTAAIYALNTMDLNAQWQLSLGMRAEHFVTTTNNVSVQGVTTPQAIPVGTKIAMDARKSDNLLSYKVGTNYKPTEDGSIYLSYATSQLPPGGANFQLSSSATNQNNPAMAPQKGTNLELGTKWSLLNDRLFATAAVFESVNKNELVQEMLGVYLPIGEKTVRGSEFGVVGKLTDNWEVNAGLSLLNPTISNGSKVGSITDGAVIQWSPKTSFTLWTTYNMDKLALGGGARYMDSVARSNNVAIQPGVASMAQIDDYYVFDAVAAYQVTPAVAVQFNIYNLLDEDYIATLNNAGNRFNQGTERSFKLGVNVAF
jgi:catecholate siderophore receptor